MDSWHSFKLMVMYLQPEMELKIGDEHNSKYQMDGMGSSWGVIRNWET